MDQSTCKAIVDRHLKPLRDFLGLGHWGVTAEYGRLDGTTAAQCWPSLDYETARIIFDAGKFDDEGEVVELIVHELGHLLSAPFDLFVEAAYRALEDQPTVIATLKRVYSHATEHHVLGIERIWRAHLADLYLDWITRPGEDES